MRRFVAVICVFVALTGFECGAAASDTRAAIAVERLSRKTLGILTLLTVTREGAWISDVFRPAEVLEFPDGVNYNELRENHRYILDALEGPDKAYLVPGENYEFLLGSKHPVYFEYEAENYKAFMSLRQARFTRLGFPDTCFQCLGVFAGRYWNNCNDICLQGRFVSGVPANCDFSVNDEALIRANCQQRVFVTGGPLDVTLREKATMPNLDRWLNYGRKSLVAMHVRRRKEYLAEKMKSQGSEITLLEQNIQELKLFEAFLEARDLPLEPYQATEDEIEQLRNVPGILVTTKEELKKGVAYINAVRGMCPWTSDKTLAEVMDAVTKTIMNRRTSPYRTEKQALEEAKEEIALLEQERVEALNSETVATEGVYAPDPDLYVVTPRITQLALPGIFEGTFLYVDYAYPRGNLPKGVCTWSGNYMAVINSASGTSDPILWEYTSDYARKEDCFSGIRYDMLGLCDANEDSRPEIIMTCGGHEFWGVEVWELRDGEFVKIAGNYGGL